MTQCIPDARPPGGGRRSWVRPLEVLPPQVRVGPERGPCQRALLLAPRSQQLCVLSSNVCNTLTKQHRRPSKCSVEGASPSLPSLSYPLPSPRCVLPSCCSSMCAHKEEPTGCHSFQLLFPGGFSVKKRKERAMLSSVST